MIRKRLILTGLLIAIVSIVASSGDAEARCGCRNRGRGWRQNTNYAYNTGSTPCSTQAGYVSGNNVSPNVITLNQDVSPNSPGIQTNINYVTSKPVYEVPADQPAVNTQRLNYVDPNSSPDVDNEGKNASKLPGTAPTKAPAPAANATP